MRLPGTLLSTFKFGMLGAGVAQVVASFTARGSFTTISLLGSGGLLVVEIGHNRGVLEAAYPDTGFIWLETEAGDEYVFLLHRDEIPLR